MTITTVTITTGIRDIITIERPTDNDTVDKLWNKMAEYGIRMEKAKTVDELMDATYKYALLKKVLEDGKANIVVICTQLAQKHSMNFDVDKFYDAVVVIVGYCQGMLPIIARPTSS